MSQKSYKKEIVLGLLKGKTHLRQLAKNLGTNAMTITRKINDLLEDNVLDFTNEGKNKVFFLKSTIEARTSILMAENYSLLITLDKYPGLRRVIAKIQNDKRIKLALLFGSYAKKTANKESDIDIFIESNDLKLKKELNQIDSRLNLKIGKLNKENLLVKEIEKNHIIIKGAELYYEKSKFFSEAS